LLEIGIDLRHELRDLTEEALTDAEDGSLFVHLEGEEGLQEEPRLPGIVDKGEDKVGAQEASVVSDERPNPTALFRRSLLLILGGPGDPGSAAATFSVTASLSVFGTAGLAFLGMPSPAPASGEASLAAKGGLSLISFSHLAWIARKLVEGRLDVEMAEELLDRGRPVN
jgi:hypothetical protein